MGMHFRISLSTFGFRYIKKLRTHRTNHLFAVKATVQLSRYGMPLSILTQ